MSFISRFKRESKSVLAVGLVSVAAVLAACAPEAPPATTPSTSTPPTAVPAITVSNTTGLASDGTATITVTGSNFDPAVVNGQAGNPVGVYVAIGVGSSSTVPEAYTSAKYVRPTGPEPETASGAKIKADGSFSATIAVKPVFTGQGRAVNCYLEACSIYVFSAHNGSYAPWTFTKTAASFSAPTAPMLAVSKTTGLAATGEAVTITGAGYATTAPGIYLVYGPADPLSSWWLDSSAFGDAKFISQAGIGANGTFTSSLTLKGSYVGSSPVDCTVAPGACSVITMKAHGSADRSQDVLIPLTFSAAAN